MLITALKLLNHKVVVAGRGIPGTAARATESLRSAQWLSAQCCITDGCRMAAADLTTLEPLPQLQPCLQETRLLVLQARRCQCHCRCLLQAMPASGNPGHLQPARTPFVCPAAPGRPWSMHLRHWTKHTWVAQRLHVNVLQKRHVSREATKQVCLCAWRPCKCIMCGTPGWAEGNDQCRLA
jgi:hypothetical protein